jgi:hypothetical protein
MAGAMPTMERSCTGQGFPKNEDDAEPAWRRPSDTVEVMLANSETAAESQASGEREAVIAIATAS